jgi:uncharacterized membrane protein
MPRERYTAMPDIGKGLGLAFITAIAWTFWSILSDIVVSINSHTAISYLTIIEIAVALISTMIFIIYIFLLGRKITSEDRRLVKYPVISGICFGIGTIIYFSLIGNQNYPLVSSFQFGYIVVLALLINRIKQEQLKRKYLLGSILVVAGFVLQSSALIQSNISGSIAGVLLLSIALLVLYAIGFYSSFYYAYGKMQIPVAGPIVVGMILGTTVIYGLATNAYSSFGLVKFSGVGLSLVIAVMIVLAYYSEQFSYRLLRDAKAKFLNLSNIISNLELVGVTLYSVFFLSISYPLLIIGLVVTFAGVLIVAISE